MPSNTAPTNDVGCSYNATHSTVPSTKCYQMQLLRLMLAAATMKCRWPCHLGNAFKCRSYGKSHSYNSPLGTPPTQNVGSGLRQREQPWLLRSIACRRVCWPWLQWIAVSRKVYEYHQLRLLFKISTVAPMRSSRSRQLQISIDNGSCVKYRLRFKWNAVGRAI